MIGQGRPNASRTPLARLARARPGMLCAALLMLYPLGVSIAQVHGEPISLRLRIAWGGGAARIWHGTVKLAQGQLLDVVPLGIEADEPGSIWLDEAGIQLRQRSLRPTMASTSRSPANSTTSLDLADQRRRVARKAGRNPAAQPGASIARKRDGRFRQQPVGGPRSRAIACEFTTSAKTWSLHQATRFNSR